MEIIHYNFIYTYTAFGAVKIGANSAGFEIVNTKRLLSGTEECKVGKKGAVAAIFENLHFLQY